MMKTRSSLTTLIALFFVSSLYAQSGAVAKGGLLLIDYARDDQSIFEQNSQGFMAGFDIRLFAEERTYLRPSIYMARVQYHASDQMRTDQFFEIIHGYDVLKGSLSFERRMIQARSFNWRLALGGTFDYIANIRGDVVFEEFYTATAGAQISSGVDIGILAVDIVVQHGLMPVLRGSEESFPITTQLTAGLRF